MTPASTAACKVARLSWRFAGPYIPDIPMQPSPSAETAGPVLPSGNCFIARTSLPASLRHLGALLDRCDINHDDADLLPCLNITVGVRNRCKGVFSIDDRSKFARFHAAFQEADKPVDSPRHWNDHSVVPCDRRPHVENYILRPRPAIRGRKDPIRFQYLESSEKRDYSNCIHHEIEGFHDTREIPGVVVDDMVRPEGLEK